MRPHDAEQIIESIGLGGHDWCPDDVRDTYEMDALETIAGMREEYRVEISIDGNTWHPGWWTKSPEDAKPPDFFRSYLYTRRRIIRRYVTTPEEA